MGSSSRAKWMLLTLFAALGCLPWDPRGRSATNGTRRSTSTPQMQPMSFCLLSTRQPDKTLECALFCPKEQTLGHRLGFGEDEVISSVDSSEGSRHLPSLIFLPLEWRESCHVPPPQPVMAVVCGTAPPTTHSSSRW